MATTTMTMTCTKDENENDSSAIIVKRIQEVLMNTVYRRRRRDDGRSMGTGVHF